MHEVLRSSTRFAARIHSQKSAGLWLTFEVLGEFVSALEEILSPSAAAAMLRTAAMSCGSNSCRRITGKGEERNNVLNVLSKLKASENWGKLTFDEIDFGKGSGKVIILNSFEVMVHKTDHSCCYIFGGFLEGFLSEFFQKSIELVEEECVGKGDKCCVFTFK